MASTMRNRDLFVLLFGIAVVTAAGCSPNKAPVRSPRYEINTAASSLGEAQVAQAIRQGAIAAGWSIVAERPGLVLVRASEDGHHATVSIRYDENGYVVAHESSSKGLEYDGEVIHRRYNFWVARLDRFLKQEMLEEYEQATETRKVEQMMPLPEEQITHQKKHPIDDEDMSAQASPESE